MFSETVAVLAGGLPYPASQAPTTSLYAIAEQGRSTAERLCLDTLAGNLARNTPQLYRVAGPQWATDTGDPYSLWLQNLQSQHSVAVSDRLVSATLQSVLAEFQSAISGYLRCNVHDASVSAALTQAAAGDGLVIAADDSISAALDSLSVPMARDLRGKGIHDVLADALPQLSTRVFIFQDPAKSEFLGDYAVFARAPTMKWRSDECSQEQLLARASGVGVAFGWGPENEYVATLSQHGIYVHPSDYNRNFAALSNVRTVGVRTVGVLRPQVFSVPHAQPHVSGASRAASHTVSFLMSDGDNTQWVLGDWFTDARWYGSPQRGAVPVGWTLSPALASLSPSALQRIVALGTPNDEFVAGPSGIGYMYPTRWPASGLSDFASLTAGGMQAAGMALLNVLGVNDDQPLEHVLSPLLSEGQVDAIVYYPYGGGYSALNGQLWWMQTKPLISGRYSLWGEATQGSMLGVQAMIDTLKTLPKDPLSSSGYSIIPVHCWSHSYADIVAVAQGLQAAGGFDIVLPSELIRRVKANDVASKAPNSLLQRAVPQRPLRHRPTSRKS